MCIRDSLWAVKHKTQDKFNGSDVYASLDVTETPSNRRYNGHFTVIRFMGCAPFTAHSTSSWTLDAAVCPFEPNQRWIWGFGTLRKRWAWWFLHDSGFKKMRLGALPKRTCMIWCTKNNSDRERPISARTGSKVLGSVKPRLCSKISLCQRMPRARRAD